MQYLCLIYEDEKEWQKLPPAETETILRRIPGVHRVDEESGNYLGGNALAADEYGDDRSRAQGQGRDDRRPVRGNQGTARRLLPAAGA